MVKELFEIESFGISDVGLVRDHNEDTWAAFPEMGLFILADGMGGHLAGEVASQEAIDHLHQLVETRMPSEQLTVEEGVNFFQRAFVQVNDWIYKKGQSSEECKGMGTTLASLFFLQNQAILAHVGDSRIYRQREGRLEQMTEDHSLIAELLSVGAVHEGDTESFPYKHILTRAIGIHANVEPTVAAVAIHAHDIFLLCSDGLTNCVTDGEIADILLKEESLSKKGQYLIDLSNAHGGGDNITLILIDVHDLPRQ